MAADPIGYRVVRLAFNPASATIIAILATAERTTSPLRLFRRTLADLTYEEIPAPTEMCEFTGIAVCETAALAFASVRGGPHQGAEQRLYAIELPGGALSEVPVLRDSTSDRLWIADVLTASHDGATIYLTLGTQRAVADGSVKIEYYLGRMVASTGEVTRLGPMASPYA